MGQAFSDFGLENQNTEQVSRQSSGSTSSQSVTEANEEVVAKDMVMKDRIEYMPLVNFNPLMNSISVKNEGLKNNVAERNKMLGGKNQEPESALDLNEIQKEKETGLKGDVKQIIDEVFSTAMNEAISTGSTKSKEFSPRLSKTLLPRPKREIFKGQLSKEQFKISQNLSLHNEPGSRNMKSQLQRKKSSGSLKKKSELQADSEIVRLQKQISLLLSQEISNALEKRESNMEESSSADSKDKAPSRQICSQCEPELQLLKHQKTLLSTKLTESEKNVERLTKVFSNLGHTLRYLMEYLRRFNSNLTNSVEEERAPLS